MLHVAAVHVIVVAVVGAGAAAGVITVATTTTGSDVTWSLNQGTTFNRSCMRTRPMLYCKYWCFLY